MEEQSRPTPARDKKPVALLTRPGTHYLYQQENTGGIWVLGGKHTESLPPSLHLVLGHLRLSHFGTSEYRKNPATFPLPALPTTKKKAACNHFNAGAEKDTGLLKLETSVRRPQLWFRHQLRHRTHSCSPFLKPHRNCAEPGIERTTRQQVPRGT